jgi:molybdate transport system substrate-binding protein
MRRLAVALGLTAALAAPARATGPESEEILVFAAASLTESLREIGEAFTARTGHRAVFSFAGSNELARQIRAGAPADVFVSADLARMEALVRAGLVREADRIDLLSNRLVVVAPSASSLELRRVGDLAGVRRLALADPEAVPAGVYARAWLTRRGLWERVREQVVPALDVRAALAAVESEAADAGIVYRTDAAASRRVRVVLEVPAGEGPRIVYPAAVLARSAKGAARAFLDELRSHAARAVFARRGFDVLEGR